MAAHHLLVFMVTNKQSAVCLGSSGKGLIGACTILPQTFERFDYGVSYVIFFSFGLAKIH